MRLRVKRVPGANDNTQLVDVTTHLSELIAPIDKIHPLPFPGLNIDNLPFFAVIAAMADGSTIVHDWVYENRRSISPISPSSVVMLLAMIATPGTSVLRNIYAINRGRDDLPDRLNSVGANVEVFRDG